jgi:ABC-type transport system involved in cytochrome c biogenesis permease subunit
VYILFCAIVSVVATVFLPDYPVTADGWRAKRVSVVEQ